MNTTAQIILHRLGINRRELTALREITPTADRILTEIEAGPLAEGKELLTELAAAEAAHPAEHAELDREAGRAARAFDATELSYRAARAARDLAQARASGCMLQLEGKRQAIHRKLRELADPRIEKYIEHLQRLVDSDLKMALRYWPESTAERSRNTSRSNVAECAAGRRAALAALAEVREAQVQALSSAEVTKALLAINARLSEALAPAWINAPSMTDYAEAGVPLPWRDREEWLAESVRDFEWANLQEADRQAAKH